MQSLFSIICFQVLCVLRPFTAFIIFSRSGLRDYGLFCLGICLFYSHLFWLQAMLLLAGSLFPFFGNRFIQLLTQARLFRRRCLLKFPDFSYSIISSCSSEQFFFLFTPLIYIEEKSFPVFKCIFFSAILIDVGIYTLFFKLFVV